jgi:aminoglycoside 2'-N-acetyltransferase I
VLAVDLRTARSDDLGETELGELRAFLTEAFAGRFDDGHWANALGGTHVLVEEAGSIIAHASVVPRTLYFSPDGARWTDAITRNVGYVESVAVALELRGRGLGTRVLETVNQIVLDQYGFGTLATSSHPFYEASGWRRWAGPTYAYRDGEVVRTADGDQWVMVLAPEGTDLTHAIACAWRAGDIW